MDVRRMLGLHPLVGYLHEKERLAPTGGDGAPVPAPPSAQNRPSAPPFPSAEVVKEQRSEKGQAEGRAKARTMALLETADDGQFPDLPGVEGEAGQGTQTKSQWRSAWNQGADGRPDRLT
eukprot:15275698-Alexandrium_andersonii.AAC.1